MSGSAPTSTRGKLAENGPSPRPTSADAVNGPTPPEGAPKVVVSNEKVMGSDAQDSKVDPTAETKGKSILCSFACIVPLRVLLCKVA